MTTINVTDSIAMSLIDDMATDVVANVADDVAMMWWRCDDDMVADMVIMWI
jgi:hypothetical protein